MRLLKNILVTGGSGFIGSNFIRFTFENKNFTGKIVNLDKLTYAANKKNLLDIEQKFSKNYFFELGNICDETKVENILQKYNIDTIVNFAAETHVDRSIQNPEDFVISNVVGTYTLLKIAAKYWKNRDNVLFHHISTDEVYGSLGASGYFFETTAYNPNSPYSASKASSDHFVNAFVKTYNLPATISNCSNNYGQFQHVEKLIPLMITNILKKEKLPVYGDGKNVRDWVYVDDHSSGVWMILEKGTVGEKYNIGGENEWTNLDLVNFLCEKIAKIEGKNLDVYKNLINFVQDRPGHDRRYAINCDKIKNLGWKQKFDFETGLARTIDWYLKNFKN